MGSVRPLDSFPLVRTSKIEELEDSLGRVIAKPVLELVGHDQPLRAIQNNCQLQHIGLNYGLYGTDVRFQFPEPTIFSQIFSIGGKAEVLVDGTSVAIDPDHSMVISADTPFGMTSNAEYERLTLNICGHSLAEKLTAITGYSIHSPLRMKPVQNFTQPSALMLRKNFMFFVNQLSAATSLPPLVLAEFEQMLMVMFLYANQHNYSHLLEQQPADVAPWQLRRAEEYIEANWDRPMSLEAVAAATDVSIGSLFRIFRRSRGYSPMEFVKQVRLRHARELLQRSGEATTVTDIAFACGFGDVDRFSDDYFQAFGEQPSETLNRGKGTGSARN